MVNNVMMLRCKREMSSGLVTPVCTICQQHAVALILGSMDVDATKDYFLSEMLMSILSPKLNETVRSKQPVFALFGKA